MSAVTVREIAVGLALSVTSLAVTLLLLGRALRLGILPADVHPRSTDLINGAKSRLSEPDLRTPRSESGPKTDQSRVDVLDDSSARGDGIHTEDALPDGLEIRLDAESRGERCGVLDGNRPGWNTVR